MMTSNRRLQMIAGAAALVIVVAWYFLLWGPESKSLKSAHKAHAAAEQQVSQLNGQVSTLNGLLQQIPADNAKFAQLQANLPDNPQLDQALNELHQAAIQTGVTLSQLAPSTPPGAAASGGQSSSAQAGSTPSITLGMTAVGNFNQVLAFLSALDGMPRTVVVDKVSLSGGNNSSSANISARIFYAGEPTP